MLHAKVAGENRERAAILGASDAIPIGKHVGQLPPDINLNEVLGLG